ncbi:prepilin peptidase [Planctomicrobium sp. SH668]|uniref:prepilin peptidase n=1 Tax=Planctomicrobium sp. SH668 TaxID=3448126 RepID=UPI003F5C0A42
MLEFVSDIPVPVLIAVLGALTGIFTFWGTRRAMRDLELPAGRWPTTFGILGLFVGALFVWCSLALGTLSTPEVIPAEGWRQLRVIYYLSMITLLLIITATDLRTYFILDWCWWIGGAIAIIGAAVSGQFQLAHVWVDWNAEIPQLRGPDIPAWLASYPQLHGVAWSLAGLAVGVISTWLIRWIGSAILGMNALGSGDVLLMGMVGAYMGWQPTVVAVLLAPLLAIGIGGFERLRGNRAALPYGPFLAFASMIVLFSWRFIWMAEFGMTASDTRDRAASFAVRRFFGDPISMLIIAGLSLGLFVALLSVIRVFKSIQLNKSES